MRHLLLLILFSICCVAEASSYLPITTEQHIARSGAVFRGKVLSLEAFKDATDDQIYTAATVQVDEVFKGRLPAVVKLVHRGGVVGNQGEIDGSSPQLKPGEERVFFVVRRPNGTYYALRGGGSAFQLPPPTAPLSTRPSAPGETILSELRTKTAAGRIQGDDLSGQAATPRANSPSPFGNPLPLVNPINTTTGLLVDSNGIPTRFILPDRGEPIPYVVDADPTLLPPGISQSQALAAVKSAMAAWSAISTVKYAFAGLQTFNQSAPFFHNRDGVLRIQLNDRFGFISGGGGDVLGEGGVNFDSTFLTNSGWTEGGNVKGSDFDLSFNGFVVISSSAPEMQSLSLFTEVLCHEIGHSIGLAHSSENPNEPNIFLQQATMYFQVHGGGRGATLGTYDPPIARQIHPTDNTPPYAYDRFMDAITTPSNNSISNVNVLQVRGYDLQTTNLTFQTTDISSGNGTFSITNRNVSFKPKAFFSSDAPRQDPTSGSFYDAAIARFTDGTNASPFIRVSVISISRDSFSEGIADAWRTAFFGNSNPTFGINHHGNQDADGDHFNNLQEFQLGSDPTNAASNLHITTFDGKTLQWQAKPYELYEIYGATTLTTNLANWVRVGNPIVPTNTIGVAGNLNTSPMKFFRVQKVP